MRGTSTQGRFQACHASAPPLLLAVEAARLHVVGLISILGPNRGELGVFRGFGFRSSSCPGMQSDTVSPFKPRVGCRFEVIRQPKKGLGLRV